MAETDVYTLRSTMRANRVLTSLAAAVILCVASANVWAKPKVAVAPFEGDANGKVRDGVAEAIDGADFTVIPKRETKRAADKVELEGISDKLAKTLAFDLGADVLVLGDVSKKAGKTTLKLTLYVDGKKAKGFSIQFKSASSPDFQKALRVTLKKKVDAASGEEDEEDEEGDDEQKPKKPKKPKQPAVDPDDSSDEEDEEDPLGEGPTKSKKPKKLKGDGDEEADEEPDEDSSRKKNKKRQKQKRGSDADEADLDEDELDDEDIESPLEKESPHQPNRAAVRLDVGVSAANRTLKFTSRSNFPEAPRDYQNSLVPAARIELELYPLAFSNPRSVAAGLGIAAMYDRTLALNLETTAEPGTQIPTKQQHWSVGARFRIVFSKRSTAPSVTLGVDYGRRTFIPDTTPLMDPATLDLPETDYTFVAPALALRVPFVKQVALVAGGEGKFVMKAGEIQTAASYGKAKIIGFEAFGGLDFVFTPRIALRVQGEFTQFGFNFVGTGGQMTNNRDGDPETKDIGGAADRSIGGVATLAVIY